MKSHLKLRPEEEEEGSLFCNIYVFMAAANNDNLSRHKLWHVICLYLLLKTFSVTCLYMVLPALSLMYIASLSLLPHHLQSVVFPTA